MPVLSTTFIITIFINSCIVDLFCSLDIVSMALKLDKDRSNEVFCTLLIYIFATNIFVIVVLKLDIMPYIVLSVRVQRSLSTEGSPPRKVCLKNLLCQTLPLYYCYF